MRDAIIDFFNYFVLFYSGALVLSYLVMVLLAWHKHRFHKTYHNEVHTVRLLRRSPYSPGISIVAPAYNEEKTIITNVLSLLSQDYPDFEVIIVNDGSTDRTLELLIEKFDLEKVPYAYVEKIKTKPFRAMYLTKSDNPLYKKLKVVDKENGGTKADASNAGVNVVTNNYFVCTDVDCILDKYALYRIIWPVMQARRRVIAVSATMRMSNGCKVKDGQVVETRAPRSILPLFQELEYTRSFLVGKSALSVLNAMQNVSGGFGMFDTEIAIKAGGYDGDSFAEDMDMIARMVRYMCESGEKYLVAQIPETCCWTEGPSSLQVLSRQRTRWGRGLLQFFSIHSDMLWNPTYRQFGGLTLPYILLFELLAPVIEGTGYFIIIYLFLINAVNYNTIWVAFVAIYSFALFLAMTVISFDIYAGTPYKKIRDYFLLFFAAMLEPIIYHPLSVFFSLRGYWRHITGRQMIWGTMTRRGVNQEDTEKTKQENKKK